MLREVRQFIQGHIARTCCSWELNSGCGFVFASGCLLFFCVLFVVVFFVIAFQADKDLLISF